MSFVKTGKMPGFETGQMSHGATGKMSAVEITRMSTIAIYKICLVSPADTCPVSPAQTNAPSQQMAPVLSHQDRERLPCTGAALGKRYIEVYPVAAAVGRSWLGGVNPPSGGGRFGKGLPPAAAVDQPKSRFLLFQQLAKVQCPSESYRDSVQGGVVDLKSYCTVVEIHRAETKHISFAHEFEG